MTAIDEHVVLLSEEGTPLGTAKKASVHSANTPLHLAFSCYLFNPEGNVLVSRRSVKKLTWPGVWTNSFCGHPAPGEKMEEALSRRAACELGLVVDVFEVALAHFRYRATDTTGIVENEICPVYRAQTTADPKPNPDEVMDWKWVNPESLVTAIRATPWAFSPWCVLQIHELYPHKN